MWVAAISTSSTHFVEGLGFLFLGNFHARGFLAEGERAPGPGRGDDRGERETGAPYRWRWCLWRTTGAGEGVRTLGLHDGNVALYR